MSTALIQNSQEVLEQTTQQGNLNDQLDALLLDDTAKALETKTSTHCRNTGIHHVGRYAKDPAASAEFYRDVLGMQVVGGSTPDHPFGATAFLTSRPNEESHEIALFANPAFAHIAFKVSSLTELRALYKRVVERNIPIKFAANHGVSFAFYFDDPDGNMIEVYWPTGDLSRPLQPYMESLDFSQSDEALLRKITTMDPQAAQYANATAAVSGHNEVTYV